MSQTTVMTPHDLEGDGVTALDNEAVESKKKPTLPLSLRLMGLGAMVYLAHLAWTMPSEICL